MEYDSEEELESFEITDEDVYNALNVKKRRKFTKEDGIYGMYARRDSDDEYDTRLGLNMLTTQIHYPSTGVVYVYVFSTVRNRTWWPVNDNELTMNDQVTGTLWSHTAQYLYFLEREMGIDDQSSEVVTYCGLC